MKTPCVQDQGLHSRIPETGIRMTTFVEAYQRLGGDLAVLQDGFHIEPWQLHAAMTFYCANKEAFDAENERILEERRKNLAQFLEKNQDKKSWAELAGWWVGEETDEDINAVLEEMS